MTDRLDFSAYEIIINSEVPTPETIVEAFTQSKVTLNFGDSVHRVEGSLHENRFYCLYSNYGKAMPHRDIVVNVASGEETDNPRGVDQVEPNGQLFVIYDSVSSLIYTSSIRRKRFIEEYFRRFSDSVSVKSVFRSVDEFVERLKYLESIKFSASRDMFSREGDIFKHTRDIFGYGEPEEFSIDAKYSIPMTDKLKLDIKKFFNMKDKGELGSVVCIGRDDSGFESVFNVDSFIRKVAIDSEKDSQGLYDANEVFSQFSKEMLRRDHV